MVHRFRDRSQDELVILDMCCGKGGDILKWLKCNAAKHVVFADIAEVSVEQCKERYSNMVGGGQNRRNEKRFTADFITADCSKVTEAKRNSNAN
jgi:mRNA (guanine-N7-)-methyltransferase